MKSKAKWIVTVIVLLFVFVQIYKASEPKAATAEEYKYIGLGGFSPDGSKLLLNFCKRNDLCGHGYFDFQKQRFGLYP